VLLSIHKNLWLKLMLPVSSGATIENLFCRQSKTRNRGYEFVVAEFLTFPKAVEQFENDLELGFEREWQDAKNEMIQSLGALGSSQMMAEDMVLATPVALSRSTLVRAELWCLCGSRVTLRRARCR